MADPILVERSTNNGSMRMLLHRISVAIETLAFLRSSIRIKIRMNFLTRSVNNPVERV